jgi:hypothetical protein
MLARFYRLSQAAKISGAMLLSALLLWATSGIQVASQQAGQGPMRSQMLQQLANNLAQLTASAVNNLDIDEAAFSSLPDSTIAYIPLAKDAPAWQLLVDLVLHRKPVGPVPIGMLYVDHEWDGGSFKLKPGYYQLKVTHYLWWLPEVVGGLWLTAEDEETITVIGEVSFGGFTRDAPQKVVQSFTIGKQNPVWFAILLGVVLLTAGGCTINIQQCNGSVCGQQNNNNPPPPGKP